jgi:hypothetical protein
MQLRNETDEEILFFAYGAPPIHGNAQFLDYSEASSKDVVSSWRVPVRAER